MRRSTRQTGLPGEDSHKQRIFHLLDEPVPALADPFPSDDPLPGTYELHLPADDVTIWYTVTEHEGQEVISVQHVSLDT
jgi:hypothetical protein